jgi:predicted nucleic acid-binding protein
VEESLDALFKFEGQGFSFVDATNVVLMKAVRTRTIFSFDAGFRKAGYDLLS